MLILLKKGEFFCEAVFGLFDVAMCKDNAPIPKGN